jgi:hypothetical protein
LDDETVLAVPAGVPSLHHELLVELVRRRPVLATELLATGPGSCSPARPWSSPPSTCQLAPTEYRADAIAVIRDDQRTATAAVIAEVQLQPDDDKAFTWPFYVAAARASLRCPVTLLVLAPVRASRAGLVGPSGWATAASRCGRSCSGSIRSPDQPEAVLVQVAVELGQVQDEAAARSALDRILDG